ncbi:hypothetical protein DFAR_2310019 [Desulfarculales bacterium]
MLWFTTGAVTGQDAYLVILEGIASSRLIVCLFVGPFLWWYLSWQNRRWHANLQRRPVPAIFKEFADTKAELSLAQQEIERCKVAEETLLRSQRELERLAMTDVLTGLANRRSFRDLAEAKIRRYQRYGRPLCLAVLDLDQFKRVNDLLRHSAGDEVCRLWPAFAASRYVRASDIPARMGGDEMALLLPETEIEHGRILCERLARAICYHPLPPSAGLVSIGLSLGLACLDGRRQTLADLFQETNRRM